MWLEAYEGYNHNNMWSHTEWIANSLTLERFGPATCTDVAFCSGSSSGRRPLLRPNLARFQAGGLGRIDMMKQPSELVWLKMRLDFETVPLWVCHLEIPDWQAKWNHSSSFQTLRSEAKVEVVWEHTFKVEGFKWKEASLGLNNRHLWHLCDCMLSLSKTLGAFPPVSLPSKLLTNAEIGSKRSSPPELWKFDETF